MPRRDTPVFHRAVWGVASFGCLALPHGIARQALASAAGILFEAAPLVLAIELVRRCFGDVQIVRRAAGLFGCGCGHAAGPAALSIPAALLTWTTFGPALALARFFGALFLEFRQSRRGSHASTPRAAGPEETDPLREIEAIAAPALALGLGIAVVQSVPAHLANRLMPPLASAALECAAGILAGHFAPCTTAAIALAAMARSTAPLAALGILATAGLTPNLAWFCRTQAAPRRRCDARLATALMGTACGILALHGGSGIVHPRLVPLVWLGCACALASILMGTRTAARHRFVPASAMLAVLVLGSPVPTPAVVSGSWDGVYPGEPVSFTGVAIPERARVSLVRYAITCCRADASPIVVPTDVSGADVRTGTWLRIRGRVENNGTELFLQAAGVEKVAAPNDVYLYR